MRRLVLDEWVWADLNGENGEKAQRETFQLLQRVFEKCDQLVAVDGSPFLRKYFNMARHVSTGDLRLRIVKVFKAQFLENSEKLHRLQAGSLPDTPTEFGAQGQGSNILFQRSPLPPPPSHPCGSQR